MNNPGEASLTCGRCLYFECFHGMTKGYCHGLPPTLFASGNSGSPEVKSDRRVCSLFNPLLEGQVVAVRSKVDPETPGDAAKQARTQRKFGK